MIKYKKNMPCFACGQSSITKDEYAICIKLLGESIDKFYCLNCLSDYLGVSKEDILDKIEEFKDEGCSLFK